MLARWTRAVVRRRRIVVLAWCVLAVLGLWASANLSGLLSTSLTVPGTQSAVADRLLAAHFEENIAGSFTIVLPVDTTDAADVTRDESAIAAAVRSIPTARVIEQKTAFGILYANVNSSFGLGRAVQEVGPLRAALRAEGLSGALVTGPAALQHDVTPVLAHDLRWGEALALIVALCLLALVLGFCGVLFMPLFVAVITIGVDIGVVFLLAHHFLMVLYVPNVIELIALGLSVDYSLLLVHRFRQELADEQTPVDDAVVATARTAGRTVVVSAATVFVGLVTLLLIPVPFLRSLGIAGVVVPLVAAASALTLQPAMLSFFGRGGVRPRTFAGLFAGRDVLGGQWARLGRVAVAHPWRVLVSSLLLVGVCAAPLGWLQLTPASTSDIPAGLPSARALTLLTKDAGSGVISPDQLIIDFRRNHLATTAANEAAVTALATRLLSDPEVFGEAIGVHPPFVSRSGRYAQIVIFGADPFGSEAAQRFVTRLRAVDVPRARFPEPVTIVVGGAPAQGVDFLNAVFGSFWWVVLVALALALVVLTRAFRSAVLAVLSVVLDLLSVAAAYGLVVWCFRTSIGATVFGTFRATQIEGWVPVFMFATLFGLSMDYQVFYVSRMREAFDAGSAFADAIVEGLGRTGGVVSAAALIMVGAVTGLVLSQVVGLQELGLGLALGIVVDATVIRGLVLPSAMALLGARAWWWPGERTRDH